MTQLPLHWQNNALMCDLYQFTMLQAYFDRGMNDTAVFEFFIRRLPAERNFLLTAGLEQALDYLEALHIPAADKETLRATGLFSAPFLDSLAGLRFTGTVDAVPEGTILFGDEPLLRITARLPEAQLVELNRLPPALRSLTEHTVHPVEIAPALRVLAAEVDARTESS